MSNKTTTAYLFVPEIKTYTQTTALTKRNIKPNEVGKFIESVADFSEEFESTAMGISPQMVSYMKKMFRELGKTDVGKQSIAEPMSDEDFFKLVTNSAEMAIQKIGEKFEELKKEFEESKKKKKITIPSKIKVPEFEGIFGGLLVPPKREEKGKEERRGRSILILFAVLTFEKKNKIK